MEELLGDNIISESVVGNIIALGFEKDLPKVKIVSNKIVHFVANVPKKAVGIFM